MLGLPRIETSSSDHTLQFGIVSLHVLVQVLVPWDPTDRAHNDAWAEDEQDRDYHSKEADSTQVVRRKAKIEGVV